MTTPGDIILEVKRVTKKFGHFTALADVSMYLRQNECLVICGPSGSGKSTLVRCINRIEKSVQSGDILYRGKSIYAMPISDIRKRIGMVFQQFNLFYHMTVEENITLAPIHVGGASREQALEKAVSLLERVDLGDKLRAYPVELSGGQKQRVAICRCLAMDPDIILFDEPTSALDPEMIKEILDIMKNLAKAGTSMICVTHELGFAKEAANRIIFMDGGKNVEENDAAAFFSSPKSIRTRQFIAQILKV